MYGLLPLMRPLSRNAIVVSFGHTLARCARKSHVTFRTVIDIGDENARSVSEFFVMRKYRRQGVGKVIDRRIFDRFPGQWEVIQHGENGPSMVYWVGVVGDYTNGDYRKGLVKTEWWEGQALLLDNSAHAHRDD